MFELSYQEEIMAMALMESAHLWIRGELDCESPALTEGIFVTTYLSSFVKLDSYKHIDRDELEPVLRILVDDKPDISTHFQKVARDRKWFKWAYCLWNIVFGNELPQLSEKLRPYLLSFDMDKYGPFEALGFHYKNSGNYSMIKESTEEREWINALNHQVINTNHHPERYVDSGMPTVGFIVSVLKMVADRLSSQLQNNDIVCPTEIMAVSTMETDRYTKTDRRDAIRYLLIWGRKLDQLLDRRIIQRNILLDNWEECTGLKMDRGLTHLVDHKTERSRREKIVNGKPIKMTNGELWTGFKLEGGEWVETWQKYILYCYKEQIYPTWGFHTSYEITYL